MPKVGDNHPRSRGFELLAELEAGMRFVSESRAKDGALFLFLRHTSASLVVQENADPDVRSDLLSALDRLAPTDAPWVHAVEGPDDMSLSTCPGLNVSRPANAIGTTNRLISTR